MFIDRRMKISRERGFTLIELLTVIAIISILSAITFSVLPKIRERAKLAALLGACKNIKTQLTAYAAKPGAPGYPPAYGFLRSSAKGKNPANLTSADFILQPWGALVELNKAADIYDKFGQTTDANHDGRIGIQEFYPIGQTDVVSGVVTFPNELYIGTNLPDEVGAQLDSKQVPIRYFPVNLAQYKAARKYWVEEARDPLAKTWNPSANSLKNLSFPPPKYDAFVLVSVGPRENSFDIFGDPPQGAPEAYQYHIAALRAFFLATRDLNQDGFLDFDFDHYTEERALNYSVNLPGNQGSYPADNILPSTSLPNGIGPKIFPDTVQNFAN